jgi:hypothetical protein
MSEGDKRLAAVQTLDEKVRAFTEEIATNGHKMSDEEKLAVVQKIDEAIECMQGYLQLLELERMNLQIKIAHAKADIGEKSERGHAE